MLSAVRPYEERRKLARAKYRVVHADRDKVQRQAAKKRWEFRNPEKLRAAARERARRRREQNPEAAKARNRTRYLRYQEEIKARTRAWALKNPDKVRSMNLQRKFGINLAEWNAKLAAQGGVCGCCGSASPLHKKGWQTDHCHETGKLRDIVCYPCNSVMIRYLDAERLSKVKIYLLRHGSH